MLKLLLPRKRYFNYSSVRATRSLYRATGGDYSVTIDHIKEVVSSAKRQRLGRIDSVTGLLASVYKGKV